MIALQVSCSIHYWYQHDLALVPKTQIPRCPGIVREPFKCIATLPKGWISHCYFTTNISRGEEGASHLRGVSK